jgi:hypothetical protein
MSYIYSRICGIVAQRTCNPTNSNVLTWQNTVRCVTFCERLQAQLSVLTICPWLDHVLSSSTNSSIWRRWFGLFRLRRVLRLAPHDTILTTTKLRSIALLYVKAAIYISVGCKGRGCNHRWWNISWQDDNIVRRRFGSFLPRVLRLAPMTHGIFHKLQTI